MRLTVDVDGERFEVDVQRDADGVRVECEDVVLKLKGAAVGAAVELEGDGQRSRLEFESDQRGSINGRAFDYHVSGFAPGAALGAAGVHQKVAVKAVMHGRLVKILTEPGKLVRKGEPLFILEAMKMQNELASPADGTISQLVAKPGDVVDVGRVLAWLERA
jgi:biotin carboxyl carrier protein